MGKSIVNTASSLEGYEVREEKLNGEEYLVVPMVMLTEGILNNLFYPWDEIERFHQAWNGSTVLEYHPKDEDGTPISANSPGVFEGRNIGWVFNSRLEPETKRLWAEAWVSVNRATEHSPQVLDRIRDKKPIEVSTGLFLEEDGVSGVFQNQEYISTVRGYRPDHLAILPNEKGACDLQMGCGVRANSAQNQPTLTETMSRIILEQAGYRVLSSKDYVLQANELAHQEIRNHLQRSIQEMDIPGEVGHWVMAVFSDYFVFEQYPLCDNGRIYKLLRRDYTVKNDDTGVDIGEEETEVVRKTDYLPIQNKDVGPAANEPGKENSAVKRTDRIEALIANEKAPWTEEDQEFLTNMTDCQFSKTAEPFENKDEADPEAPEKTPKENTPATPEADETPKEVTPNSTPGSEEDPVENEEETEEQVLANIKNPRHREIMERNFARDRKERADMIGKIKSNENNPYDDKELEGMSYSQLEKLIQFQGETEPKNNYEGGGRGPEMSVVHGNGSDQVTPTETGFVPLINKEQKEGAA